ncbi:MAG TPA: hypothetical protein VLT33_42085 [Labilithrix sp.]|nr:hypothetical protein [Labilithrix sp.]
MTRSAVRPAILGILLAAALVSAAPRASADPSLSDRETARSLMDDGDAKRDKGDFKAALKSYEAADAIMHVPTTGLEVARAQAQLGLLLEARETLGRVLRLPPRPGEPPPFTAARKSAEQMNADLATRIPSITVAVTNADAGQPVQLVFDGEVVPPAAAQAPRKVNPGRHSVVARAGAAERKEEVTVAERDARTVTIDLKQPPVAVEPVRAVEPAQASPSALPRVLMFGGFGLAAVGIGVGSVTGLMSFAKVDDVKKDCVDNRCKPSREADINSARSLGTISTVAFIVGGAGVAAGIIGIVLSGKQTTETPPGTSARITIVPDVGPTWLGAHGAF